MLDVGRHPRINLLAYSEVKALSGRDGDFRVTVLKKARYVDEDKCTACGDCVAKCPIKKIPDEFNEGLSHRRAIYIHFPQGIPAVYTIDAKHCTWFLKAGKCGACKLFCKAGAIDFEQKDREIELSVGAVIVAMGYAPYDPAKLSEYGFGRIKNVVTAIQYERMINASGPSHGHLLRPSDQKPVKSVAFLQCVGSRDERTNPYCCTYGCMHSIKEAILAREHDAECEASIFYTDMRAVGKAFDEYRVRGSKQYGINYVRGRVGEIAADRQTGDPVIYFEDTESQKVYNKRVDLAVLAAGCAAPPGVEELCGRLGLDLTPFKFIKTDPFNGIETSRPGVLAVGCCTGPMDIPESVAQASSAAAEAAAVIGAGRPAARKAARASAGGGLT